MRLALFASGNGSNVQAIIQAVEAQQLDAEIGCIVCDEPEAYVIERARQANIPVVILAPQWFKERGMWEAAILRHLEAYHIEWIALAGFMRIVGETLLTAYPQRIINIHPALLPNFPGRHGIEEAYRAGVKQTGVTVHYVDGGIDTGEIIAQEVLAIHPDWTIAELETAIHQIEHRLYPQVIQKLSTLN